MGDPPLGDRSLQIQGGPTKLPHTQAREITPANLERRGGGGRVELRWQLSSRSGKVRGWQEQWQLASPR